jgi:hypothetical protein
MSQIVLSGDTSGAITIAAPAIAGTNTLTLPAKTGTVMVSGNMPTFSVGFGGSQTINNGATSKIQFGTVVWDTANCFDAVTNYRFTPNVAGYYQLNASVRMSGGTSGGGAESFLAIYQNNSALYRGTNSVGTSSSYMTLSCSGIAYCNGTTDYIEIFVYNNTGSNQTITSNTSISWFNGCLLRTA